MSGPFCPTCRYYSPTPLGGGECTNWDKRIWHNDNITEAPEVYERSSCGLWAEREVRATRAQNPAHSDLQRPDITDNGVRSPKENVSDQ